MNIQVRRIWIIALLGGTLLGSLFVVPTLQNWLVPEPVHVTIAEIAATPAHYHNRFVEIHGVFQRVQSEQCGIPGPESIRLADTFLPGLVVRDTQSPPPTVIFVDSHNTALQPAFNLVPGTPLVVWGYVRQHTNDTVVSCSGTIQPAATPVVISRLDIIRVQLPHGRVLP